MNFIRQIYKAKDETSTPFEFVAKTWSILCNSILFTLLCVLSLGLPIAMIVIGATRSECPVGKYIPIWLIVFGSTACLTILLRLVQNIYGVAT